MDLVDLARPRRRRVLRGALIGTVFGGFVIPKIAVMIYVFAVILSR